MKLINLIGLSLTATLLCSPAMGESASHAEVLSAAAEYPISALRRGQTGEVVLEYSVNESGRAENIRVLDSGPNGAFDNAAIRAVRQSVFSLAPQTDQASSLSRVQQRFVFDLPTQ